MELAVDDLDFVLAASGTPAMDGSVPSSPHSRPASPTAIAGSRPTAKRKREKYTGKACGPCKKRKIKCGGGTPCAACVRRKRPCTLLEPEDGLRNKERHLDGDIMIGAARESESVKSLQSRMEALETHLMTLNQALLRFAPAPETTHSVSGPSPTDRQSRGSMSGDVVFSQTGHGQISSSHTSGASPKDGLKFTTGKHITNGSNAGETSVLHALRRVEDRLSELGLPIVDERGSAPETPPMTPSGLISEGDDIGARGRGIIHLMYKHGVRPNREEWDAYLETFLIEVHLLYPFLSEELVREMYSHLWESVANERVDLSTGATNTDHMVQALLVLANGRCARSSRIQNAGSNSAGWSLYCTAMELQGSLLDIVSDDSNPLSSLHTLTLVVLYLLRLDATERAQKILSIAIVHAHQLGIHLNQTHAEMPKLQSELFKRVWWCMYVLDRRLALVLGRPFIIHDNNIKIGLIEGASLAPPIPINSRIHNPLDQEPEMGTTDLLSMEYLNVMVGYSKVVGKVCETLFGSQPSDHQSTHVHEYLDCLVNDWMACVPLPFLCETDDIHRTAIPMTPALFKQRFLIRIRFLSLLNMIRSPLRHTKGCTMAKFNHDIEAETICLQRARQIVDMFGQCSLADGVYGFPFLPHLLEATILMLACLTRLPYLKPAYRDTVDVAIEMLKKLYRKTWVSGKVARIISKLGDIIPQVFSSSRTIESPLSQTATNRMTSIEHSNQARNLNGSESIARMMGNYVHSPPVTAHTHSQHAWDANNSAATESTFHEQYRQNMLDQHIFPDNHSANLDFQFDDFPFELDLGSAVSQNSLLHTYSVKGAEIGMNGLSGQSLDAYNMDWLQNLVAQDGRLSGFG